MKVEYFHSQNGDLVTAMKLAWKFIEKVGDECIAHVYTDYDLEYGRWTVNVLYDSSVVRE